MDMKALNEISPKVRNLLGTDIDIIFAGDFNCDPWNPSMDTPAKPLPNYMPTVIFSEEKTDTTGKKSLVTVVEHVVALINEPTMTDSKSLSINDNILIAERRSAYVELKSNYPVKEYKDTTSPVDKVNKIKELKEKQKITELTVSDENIFSKIKEVSDHYPVVARFSFPNVNSCAIKWSNLGVGTNTTGGVIKQKPSIWAIT